jgi:hypothetical protein
MDSKIMILLILVSVCLLSISSSISTTGGGLGFYLWNSDSETTKTPEDSDDTKSPDDTDDTKNPDVTDEPVYPKKYYMGATCPDGWEDHGQSGILIGTDQKDSSPFSPGGELYPGWFWTHPRICYGEANPDSIKDLYKFSASGNANDIKVGIITSNNNKVPTDITGGGEYNPGWTWVHPYLKPADSTGGYTFSDTDSSNGYVGIILNTNDKNKSKFDHGGGISNDWTWMHPYLKED